MMPQLCGTKIKMEKEVLTTLN